MAAEHRFRIATVAELSGVPETTLRAWERRYGVPAPERARSGYRLYSEADLQQAREMRMLCESGLSAIEAAQLISTNGARSADVGPGPRVDPAKDVYALIVDNVLAAIDRFDDVGLDLELRRMMFVGGAIQLLDRVLCPVLAAMRERYGQDACGAAQERFATHAIGTVMRDLVRLLPGARARYCAVLASFAEEQHELGPLSVGLRLAALGVRPVFLGARTPPWALRSVVERLAPRLIVLSITVPPPLDAAADLLRDYASACGGAPWLVGGAGSKKIADLVLRAGGRLSPEDPGELESVVAALLPARVDVVVDADGEPPMERDPRG